MRADLTDLRTRTESGFAAVDNGFAAVRARLDATAAGQERTVATLLDTLTAGQGDRPTDR